MGMGSKVGRGCEVDVYKLGRGVMQAGEMTQMGVLP